MRYEIRDIYDLYKNAYEQYARIYKVMKARILINALRLNTKYVPYPICNAFSTSLPIERGLSLQSCEGLL